MRLALTHCRRPARKDVALLRSHHSMGGGRWKGNSSYQGHGGSKGGSAKWGLWRGAWPSPKAEKTAFPDYDHKRVPEEWTEQSQEPPSFGQRLQHSLNSTRRAEQRVTSLQNSIKERKRQWIAYQEDMKAAWLKEKARCQRELDRLDGELSKAYVLQENARKDLLNVANREDQPPAPVEGEAAWNELLGSWQAVESDTAVVLQRAMSATSHATSARPAVPMDPASAAALRGFAAGVLPTGMEPLPGFATYMEHLARQRMQPQHGQSTGGQADGPAGTSQPVAEQAGFPPDPFAAHANAGIPAEVHAPPYVCSPSHPGAAAAPTGHSPMPRPKQATQNGQRVPVKTRTPPPVPNNNGPTMEEKLEAKRAAATAAMHPFHLGAARPPQAVLPEGTATIPEGSHPTGPGPGGSEEGTVPVHILEGDSDLEETDVPMHPTGPEDEE